MTEVGMLFLGLFIGAALGIFLMGLLSANHYDLPPLPKDYKKENDDGL